MNQQHAHSAFTRDALRLRIIAGGVAVVLFTLVLANGAVHWSVRDALEAASPEDVGRRLRDVVLLQVLAVVIGAVVAASLFVRTSRRAVRVLDDVLEADSASLEQARRVSEFNQQFLADVAHQLRTPLADIHASAELIAMRPTPEEREHLLADLVRSTERAALLVNALLRLTRIDQGAVPEGEPADLCRLCESEIERFGATCSVEISLDADGGPHTATVDGPSMREAIGNLLDNARRHARHRVDVHLRSSRDLVVIEIRDDGPGMDERTAARAFERFASFGTGQGAGLGLPIARGVVEAHSGELVYERGAFVIRLPAGEEGEGELGSSAPDKPGKAHELLTLALELRRDRVDEAEAVTRLQRAATRVGDLRAAYRLASESARRSPSDRHAARVRQLLGKALASATREWRESERMVQIPPWLRRTDSDPTEEDVIDLRDSDDDASGLETVDVDALAADLERLRRQGDEEPHRRWWRR